LGFGVGSLGVAQWLKYRRWSGFVKALLGLGIAFAFRPYVALAAVLSLVAATLGCRARYTPIAAIKSIAVMVVMLPVLAYMWQGVSLQSGVTEISGASFVDRISSQGAGNNTGGGSEVSTDEIHGIGQFVTQLPEGAIRLLFRPWPWEATSFFMFVAALDNIALMVVLIARRRTLMKSLRQVRTQPYAFYCLLLTLGLTAIFSTIPNLGLAMRQKTQITPFLYFLAFTGDKETQRHKPARSRQARLSVFRRPQDSVPVESGGVAAAS